MIGLSLSLCVSDIARGEVAESQVEKIIASTRFRNSAEFEQVLQSYSASYWSGYSHAVEIARRLYAAGKIEQPRLFGHQAHNISGGHWRS